MSLFIFAILLALAGLVLLAVPLLLPNRLLGLAAGVLALVLSLGFLALSTAIYVDDDKGGIVVRKFGPDLPTNRIVAVNGEKGPQAKVLGPGWHFGYWPWLYDLKLEPTITIEQGYMGVVGALDGEPLPANEIYAAKWTSAEDMLDGEKFLATGKGQRGPQLTVLTPGRYRYNTRLFTVVSEPVLTVDVGEVAVVKSNTGQEYVPTAADAAFTVNGTPLVPEGYRGIWRTAITPGQKYLHPGAYSVTKVRTTNRTYTYQKKDWAIRVRSKDGFTFPIDVRVAVSISAADAPHLVALLGNPDAVVKDDQEDETISVLEARIILPLVRAVFRNVAEGMNALQFVNSRSKVESDVTAVVRTELSRNKLASDGVFIGNIDLDETEAGKQLLSTQTEREVAINQEATFKQKRAAEESRAQFILAQEEAEQQRNLAQAKYMVLVKEQEAKAREAQAVGEGRFIEITALARKTAYEQMASAIGAPGVVTLEMLKLISEGKIEITPQVMVTGGGTVSDALMGTILQQTVGGPKK